jgi:hypothetical protein
MIQPMEPQPSNVSSYDDVPEPPRAMPAEVDAGEVIAYPEMPRLRLIRST